MGRNRHNCAGTVIGEYEVADEHADFTTVYGVNAMNAL